MKNILSVLLIIITFSAFTSCRGRDDNGSTDVSNMSGSKDRTDSTRGTPEANSTQGGAMDTMRVDSLRGAQK